jgi:hypothetical protein
LPNNNNHNPKKNWRHSGAPNIVVNVKPKEKSSMPILDMRATIEHLQFLINEDGSSTCFPR